MGAHFRMPDEGREALYQSILRSSHPDAEYLTMVALSALIALFGLLQNSVAVIIGAMLISPLMNPILAASLALVLGDGKLGRKAAVVLGVSIAAAILVSAFISWLVPLKQATPEILARTNPNLLDLAIAFLSGLAGTLALRSSSSSLTIIPGVAIAVAVMPPLATVGYGISSGQGTIAGGAFLLFVTNLVSILISAAVVFSFFGFLQHEAAEKGHLRLRYRMAISAVVLALLAIPLLQTLRTAVQHVRLRAEVMRLLEREFKTPHSSVTDLTVAPSGDSFLVHATVRTTEYFQDQVVAAAQNVLRGQLGAAVKLEIDQLLVTQGGLTAQQAARLRDFISGRIAQPAPKEEAFDPKTTQERLLAYLQNQLDEVLAGTTLKRAGPLRVALGGHQPLNLIVSLTGPEPVEAQTVKILGGQLAARLSSPVELHGTVALEGRNYSRSFELKRQRAGVGVEERKALTELVRRVVTLPDLRLQISLANPAGIAEGERALLLRQIGQEFARNGLKRDRWRADAEPAQATARVVPSELPAGTRDASPLPVRVEVSAYQEF